MRPPWWSSSPRPELSDVRRARAASTSTPGDGKGRSIKGVVHQKGLADGTRERDHVDAPYPSATKCRGCRSDGRTRRVDVVNQNDGRADRCGSAGRPRDERAADVPPPFRQAQPRLPIDSPRPLEQRQRLEPPAGRKLPCERGCRMVSSPHAAIPVRRNEGDEISVGPRNHLHNKLPRHLGEATEAALLPCPDERGRRGRVRDGGACTREREASSGALRAPRDRPRGGRAAASAERRLELVQRAATLAADDLPRRARGAAGRTTRREEKVDEPLRSR